MKHRIWGCSILALLAVLVLAPAQVVGQDEAVLEVVAVDTHGKTAEYIASLEPLLKRLKEVAPKTETKIYEADLSGEFTGTVYVTIRYPNMEYMAQNRAKAFSDPQFTEALQAVAATGRTIISRSLLVDRTP
ncbi:MAG TPA: hypothetical protein VLU25_10190 [Acidobacteriota bacterium]|nr:hypothetical protein [Acidobacteriota bacterium]